MLLLVAEKTQEKQRKGIQFWMVDSTMRLAEVFIVWKNNISGKIQSFYYLFFFLFLAAKQRVNLMQVEKNREAKAKSRAIFPETKTV